MACFRLLIGADGGNSVIRRLSGIPTFGWGYGETAIVATVKVNLPLKPFIPASADIKDNNSIEVENLNQSSDNDNTSTNKRDSVENSIAYQRFLQSGPLALLPLWNGYSSIVWSTSPDHAKYLKSLSKEDFILELNKSIRHPPVNKR